MNQIRIHRLKTLCALVAPLLGALNLLAAIEEVDARSFAELSSRDDVLLVDVRTPQEIAQGKIANASELDFYDPQFAKKIARLQRDKTVLLYCRSGSRSGQAAKLLQAAGYKSIVNLEGGIGAWQLANMPLVTPDNTAPSPPPATKLSAKTVEKALAAGGLTLLDFHTQWCSPCRRMAPVIDQLENERGDTLKVLRIDADANAKLAAQYDVTAVPTFVILRDGLEIWRSTGIVPLETFQEVASSR